MMLVAPPQASPEPEWKTVLGAKVLFAPIDRKMMRRARRSAIAAMGRDEHGPDADGEDAVHELGDIGDAISFALIMAGALDWDPMTVATARLDADGSAALDENDQPIFDALPFSTQNLANLLADPVIFDAFDTTYVMPFARRERAKNGFAASPNGTGEAATAAHDIATSVANPGPTDGAQNARTVSKRPRQRKPKASGKS